MMKKHTAQITTKSIEQSGLPSDFKKAIAEYIWNGFDAKATNIELKYDANELGYLNSFSITDDGNGINLESIDETFGHFMDSKKSTTFEHDGFVKGKKGKGRYSFANFCDEAIWHTTSKENNSEYIQYEIIIKKETLEDFHTSQSRIAPVKKTGTTVSFKSFHSLTSDLLESDIFLDFLASEFGWFLFLNKESNYKIKINNKELDYWSIIGDFKEFDNTFNDHSFRISFIRWKKKIGDKYYNYFLNQDKKEVERKHTSFNNKAIDFHHSVYIVSDYFENFAFTQTDNPTLGLEKKNQSDDTFKQLNIFLKLLINEAEKSFIREEQADKLIEDYNSKNIFPPFKNNTYEQIRKKDLENVVKEIYCTHPVIFQKLRKPQSKTLVGFLNLLLDTEQRENILDILENIIELSDEERVNLSNALKKTKLTSITALVQLLQNRFEVVNVLKKLVFELEKFTNERDHIQKVIENNYWLFGEQYHIVSADQNFETALNNYLDFTETDKKHKEKLTSKNRLKRPDIFIARQIEVPDSSSDELTIEENIIVELKRPSVVIGKKQFDQIEDYIRFIIKEPKFNSELRRWKLILIGKEVDDWIKDRYDSNKNKGKRFLIEAVKNYEIFAMTWDDLFKIFDIRHKHLISKLEFKSSIIEDLEGKGVIAKSDQPNELLNQLDSTQTKN
ncbi:ATP-binding protein [Marinifilum breve]|uniref:ATP-binding protein n=1 Tax=Marinifilum breve TaxID=2184082 RepID=A0A2V3ZYR1_9BACT|nr:ATP-binding protein [Marinifilum breve]PXY01411.1 ATP-binding protein [Marinifilum breve]